eukprot:IDg8883t1
MPRPINEQQKFINEDLPPIDSFPQSHDVNPSQSRNMMYPPDSILSHSNANRRYAQPNSPDIPSQQSRYAASNPSSQHRQSQHNLEINSIRHLSPTPNVPTDRNILMNAMKAIPTAPKETLLSFTTVLPGVTMPRDNTIGEKLPYPKSSGSISGISELVNINQQILGHLVALRESVSQEKQRLTDAIICISDSCATMKSHMQTLSSEINTALKSTVDKLTLSTTDDTDSLALFAHNFVKLNTLMAMAPSSNSTGFYNAFSTVGNAAIREASAFALRTSSDEKILEFLSRHLHSKKNGKQSGPTFCPTNCAIRTGAESKEETRLKCIWYLITTNEYKTSPDFFPAWYHCSVMALSKTRSAAIVTRREIQEARPNSLIPAIWPKTEVEDDPGTIEMSICAFAFVVIKVSFDLRRKLEKGSHRDNELNGSYQLPWAAEALRIDSTLAETYHPTRATVSPDTGSGFSMMYGAVERVGGRGGLKSRGRR